jgi:hypothetical protein
MHRALPRRRVRLHGALLLLALLPACLDVHSWVEKKRPWSAKTIEHTDEVRLERSDGSEVTLEHPRIDKDEQGEFLAGQVHRQGNAEVRVHLASVRTLETREVQSGNVAASIAAGLVVAAAAVLYILHGTGR